VSYNNGLILTQAIM